jgi:iron complex outermembrane receptor protein
MNTRLSGSTLIVFAALTGLPVQAQLASSPTPEAPGESAVALAPLLVTGFREKGFVPQHSAAGTKTETSLLEAPQSIQVVTSDQLAALGARGIEEALRYSPGISGGNYGYDPRSDWTYVRGFQPTRYLDGLPLPEGAWAGLTRLEPFGLERIEVLKGAASALYGQMPPGGLINIVSKRPTSEPIGAVEVGLGSFGQTSVGVDLGGPLNSSADLRYRFTGLLREGETFVDHTHDDRLFLAPALTWRLGEQTWLTFLARYQEADTNAAAGFLPTQGTLTDNPNGTIPLERYTGETSFDRYKKKMASGGYEFEHRINDTWRVRQNVRYSWTDVDHRLVSGLGLAADQRTLFRYAYTPAEVSRVFAADTQAEARFSTGPVSHTFLSGIDYRRSTTETSSGFGSAPSIDIFAPVYGAAIETPATSSQVRQTQSQLGLYLQDQVRLQQWILTVGARQDFVETDTNDQLAGTHADQEDDKLSGRVGLSYVFSSGLAPYAGWSTSFQPTIGTDFSGRAFAPTTGDLLEAGVKYQPRGSRHLFTAAVYTSTLDNALTVDPDHLFFSIQQGRTRVRGIELEAKLAVTGGLAVIASCAYTDAEVVRTTEAAALGRRVPLVPRQQASAWVDYTLPQGRFRGLGAGLGVRYVGRNYGDAFNQWSVPSHVLADASLHYDWERWRVQLNVSNALDKRYVAAALSEIWAFYGSPRTLSLNTSYRW